MNARIVLTGSHDKRLRDWLTGHPDGHERGAWVLFRRFARDVPDQVASPRLVAVDVVELDADWVLESSKTHIKINMRLLPPLYLRCEQEGLELGFAHSHPDGALFFSGVDDLNEQAILQGYAGCNGDSVALTALVLSGGQWLARTRSASARKIGLPARHVAILSERIELHLDLKPDVEATVLARQEAAFGKPFNRKMQSMRAVVVGAGGTGSPTATLLARSGIGELVLVDGDKLEATNLNRVRGYGAADVGKNKADTLAAYIRSLGLNCQVSSIPEYLDGSPAAIDAVSSADIVFGCTDDVAGRDCLNQAAYYYCVPYIDMGLTGVVAEDADGQPYLRDHQARISTILPEAGACLRCQGVVSDAKLAYERAIKANPELKKFDPETLRREYYLTGGGESAPGVGPFTSMTADFSLATFMDLIRGYRRLASDHRRDNIWIDFVCLDIRSNMPKNTGSCFCCGAKGLLNVRERGYRLDMPRLGKIPAP